MRQYIRKTSNSDEFPKFVKNTDEKFNNFLV